MRRLVTAPDEALTGPEVRSLTARVTASRTRPGTGELLTNLANVVVSAAVVVGLVVGASSTLRDLLVLGDDAGTADGLPLGVVRVLLVVAGVAGLTGLAARLGPVGLPGAGLRWWVPMPLERRGLLVPSLRRSLVLWSGGTAVLAPVLVLTTGATASLGSALLAAACGAVVGALVAAGTGLAQACAGASARVQRTGDAVLAAVPVLGVVLLLLRPGDVLDDSAWWSGPWWAWSAVAAGAVVAVLLTVRWDRSLASLGARALTAQSAVADHAGASALSLDTRELGRALAAPPADGRAARRLASRPARLEAVRGPATALLAGEWVAARRDRRMLLQVVALASLAVVVQQVPGLGGGLGLCVVALLVGLRAGQVGAGGARAAEVAPLLDSMLPLGARQTRVLRSVLPSLVATVCVGAVMLPVALASGAAVAGSVPLTVLSWAGLALASGASFGGAAVRGAYRLPPSWSAPLLATPAGAVPTGVVASLLRGPDLALFGAVPLLVALVLGAPVWPVLLAQVLVATVALAVGSWVPRVG